MPGPALARGLSILRGVASGGGGGSGRVTVRGGHRLRRFIADFRGLSNGDMADILARVLRNVVLPELKANVPRNTGKLARSLKIERRGEAVELRGVFYGRFIQAGSQRDTVSGLAMRIIDRRADQIKDQLAIAIKSRLGV